MNSLLDKSIKELNNGLINGDFSCVDLIKESIEVNKKLKKLNCYVTEVDEAELLKKAKEKDEQELFKNKFLEGIPFSIKDAYVTKGVRTTSSSKVLDSYIPQYNATVYKKVVDSGGILVGKTNHDAWGHGGSSENTDFGPVKNPWDNSRSAGGSSGGSAVSVSSRAVSFSIAEDTGGSIRNPSSWCGVTGLKVSYGRVSRYGAIAYASSFDTVGPIAKSAEDCAYILKQIAGNDPYDGTSSDEIVKDYVEELNRSQKYTFAVPKEFFSDGLDVEVSKSIMAAISELKKMGHKIIEVNFPIFEYAVALYYIIAPSETSSNLARYDGIRFGNPRDKFSEETARRIMMGTYSLSTGYADKFYLNAQKARTMLIDEYNKIFDKADFIVSPVMPTTATNIGELLNDPVKNWLADIYTVTQNPAGVPSLAIPTGFSKDKLPIGMQIVGPMFSEDRLLNVGYQFQKETNYHEQKPNI